MSSYDLQPKGRVRRRLPESRDTSELSACHGAAYQFAAGRTSKLDNQPPFNLSTVMSSHTSDRFNVEGRGNCGDDMEKCRAWGPACCSSFLVIASRAKKPGVHTLIRTATSNDGATIHSHRRRCWLSGLRRCSSHRREPVSQCSPARSWPGTGNLDWISKYSPSANEGPVRDVRRPN